MTPKKNDAGGTKAAKGGEKGKAKSGANKDSEAGGPSKLKAATAINTRHILVSGYLASWSHIRDLIETSARSTLKRRKHWQSSVTVPSLTR